MQNLKLKIDKELLELIKDEVNVKEIVFDESLKTEIKLDKKITSQLSKKAFSVWFWPSAIPIPQPSSMAIIKLTISLSKVTPR